MEPEIRNDRASEPSAESKTSPTPDPVASSPSSVDPGRDLLTSSKLPKRSHSGAQAPAPQDGQSANSKEESRHRAGALSRIMASARTLFQNVRAAVEIVRESAKFTHGIAPSIDRTRKLCAAGQALQFAGMGIVIGALGEAISGARGIGVLALYGGGFFAFKGILDQLNARSQSTRELYQSLVQLRIQERLASIMPRSAERRSEPQVASDLQLTGWGGIWQLATAGNTVIEASSTAFAMGVSVVAVGCYGPAWLTAFLAGSGLVRGVMAFQRAGRDLAHERSAMELKNRANEIGWSRTWGHVAQARRALGIDRIIDRMAHKAMASVVDVEREHSKLVIRDARKGNLISFMSASVAFPALGAEVLAGSITLPEGIFAGITMVPVFFSSLDGLARNFSELIRARPTLEAIGRLENIRRQEALGQREGAIDWGATGASLKFDKVSFGYRKGSSDAPAAHLFQDLSLSVQVGEFVAVVGDNGSGKSSLFSLVDRSYRPVSGTVTINDVPVSSATDENLYQGLRFLTQDARNATESCAFTVSKFLSLARLSVGLPEDRALLSRILKELGIEDELSGKIVDATGTEVPEFPLGLETIIGKKHGGVDFSGGQMALINLAFMLYGGAKIMCFDEPEKAIAEKRHKKFFETLRSLDSLLGYKPTVLLITHRVDVATIADKVLYLDKAKGGFAGYGPHEELLKTSPDYKTWFEQSTRKPVSAPSGSTEQSTDRDSVN